MPEGKDGTLWWPATNPPQDPVHIASTEEWRYYLGLDELNDLGVYRRPFGDPTDPWEYLNYDATVARDDDTPFG